jgi:hypothetical protein
MFASVAYWQEQDRGATSNQLRMSAIKRHRPKQPAAFVHVRFGRLLAGTRQGSTAKPIEDARIFLDASEIFRARTFEGVFFESVCDQLAMAEAAGSGCACLQTAIHNT